MGGIKALGNRLDSIGSNQDAAFKLMGSEKIKQQIGFLFDNNMGLLCRSKTELAMTQSHHSPNKFP